MWCGRYYPGAMRARRAARRAAALTRQKARRAHARSRQPCTKQPFTTLEDAERALLDCQIRRVLKGREKRQERRIYVCRDCGAWHLTSHPGQNGAAA